MGKQQSVLLIGDVQHPYNDKVTTNKIIEVARRYQPDAVVQIGDMIDFPTVSRWAKNEALEYAETLQEHIDTLQSEFLFPLRQAAPNAAITWVSGNHDERIADYVKKYAPALRPLRALGMESLFGLADLDVQYVKGPVRIATNVYAIHGHESGGYCASLSAWDAKFQRRYGSDKSYVFGHTHSPGLVTRAYGWKGDLKPRFTMNLGSTMDPNAATYIRDGAVSWQQSFAWLEDDGKRVWPELVTLVDRLGYFKGQRL